MITQGNIFVFQRRYRRAESELSELTYYNALQLVAWIDDGLQHNTSHFRNKAGELLETLYQVVNAILADDLALPPQEKVIAEIAPGDPAAKSGRTSPAAA